MTKSTLTDTGKPSPGIGTPSVSSGRRRMLLGTVAASATLAGIGLAWWNKPGVSGPATGRPALWDLTFDAPGEPALHMQTLAGKPLLLNFWATWCPPCVEEFPLLDRFYQANSANGWQVLGLAVDQLAAVESFLHRVPVRFPIALAGLAGIELSKTLGNVGGGLPFTVVLGSAGYVVHRKIGRVDTQDLSQWSTLK